MAETPTYKWRTPNAEDPSDGPNDMLRLGTDIENTLKPVADRLEERTWDQFGFGQELDVQNFTIPLPADHQYSRLRIHLRGRLQTNQTDNLVIALNGSELAGQYSDAYRRWDASSNSPVAVVHRANANTWRVGAWGAVSGSIAMIDLFFTAGDSQKSYRAESFRPSQGPTATWWQTSWGNIVGGLPPKVTSIRVGTSSTSNSFLKCAWWVDGARSVGIEDDDPGGGDGPEDPGNEIPDRIPGAKINADGVVYEEPGE